MAVFNSQITKSLKADLSALVSLCKSTPARFSPSSLPISCLPTPQISAKQCLFREFSVHPTPGPVTLVLPNYTCDDCFIVVLTLYKVSSL